MMEERRDRFATARGGQRPLMQRFDDLRTVPPTDADCAAMQAITAGINALCDAGNPPGRVSIADPDDDTPGLRALLIGDGVWHMGGRLWALDEDPHSGPVVMYSSAGGLDLPGRDEAQR